MVTCASGPDACRSLLREHLVPLPPPAALLRSLRRFVTACAFFLTGLRACQDGEPLLRPIIVSCTRDGPFAHPFGGPLSCCFFLSCRPTPPGCTIRFCPCVLLDRVTGLPGW